MLPLSVYAREIYANIPQTYALECAGMHENQIQTKLLVRNTA